MSSDSTVRPDVDPASSGGDAQPPLPETGRHRAAKDPGWFKRHKVLASIILVLLLVVVAVGGYLLWLYLKLGSIEQFKGLGEEGRPDPAPGEALNILLLGEDNESGGSPRSDTIIIAHIPEDREDAYLVSIPRDSYVPIYDNENQPQGKNKINAAYSLYGKAAATQATVEHLIDARIDHVAVMNWDGFKDLSTALDGVRVYIPESFYDSSQDKQWEKGWQNVQGTEALQYVRTRYDLPDESGDFGRIARQQNFMRALMGKMLSQGMNSPSKLPGLLDAVGRNLNVDEDWSTNDIVDLAVNMRGVRSDDVTFLTAPMGGYDDTTDAGSVVLLHKRKSRLLWGALREDGKMTIDEYAEKFQKDVLESEKKVN